MNHIHPGNMKQDCRYRSLENTMRIYLAMSRTGVGLSIDTLAEIAGRSKRTVMRYLDALERAGAVISVTEGDHGRVLRMVRER